jgi:Caspase domain
MPRSPSPRSRLLLAVLGAVLAIVWARRASAAEKFAVIVGNNKGDPGEVELRYAESDAQRIYDTLKDLGGVPPANMVLLRGEQSSTLLRTLVATNDRIRSVVANPENQAVLFVYFSGHADSAALHLGGSRFELAQLEQIVRGSAATFRVLVSDACRSGALTRVKGGQQEPPFPIVTDEKLSGEGVVFLTASSANEDAQESDELRGSFFTHAFNSGLLGAADADGDGRVTLEEAYRYAHDTTVRSSSRTLSGTQHPTFRYELRGQGKVVLTDVRDVATRATLIFPEGRTYVVMEGSQSGAVVGEVSAASRSRRLSVRRGRYFVRGRLTDSLLEGELDAPGGEVRVTDDRLHKVAYARLVRKGGSDVTSVHGPVAGYTVRSPMNNATTACQGAFVGYDFAFSRVGITPRISGCHSSFSNATLAADVDELGIDVRLYRAWDLPIVTVDLGVSLGASLFRQTFHTSGVARDRQTGAPSVAVGLGLSTDLGRGFYPVLQASAQTYLYRFEDSAAKDAWTPAAAVRFDAGLGKHW